MQQELNIFDPEFDRFDPDGLRGTGTLSADRQPAFDDTEVVQAFFDRAVAAPFGKATISGTFHISRPIVLDGFSATPLSSEAPVPPLTRIFEFNAKFLAFPREGETRPDTVLEFRNMEESIFSGLIAVDGIVVNGDGIPNRDAVNTLPGRILRPRSAHSIKTRFTTTGVRILNCGRSSFGRFRVDNVIGYGVDIEGDQPEGRDDKTNNSYLSVEAVVARHCGPSNIPGGASDVADYALDIEHVPRGERQQYSVLTVSSKPPVGARRGALAVIGGDIYSAQGFNEDGSTDTASLHPWVPEDVETFPGPNSNERTGRITWYYGGAVRVIGSDASVVKIDLIDAYFSSFSLLDAAQYGPIVNRVSATLCGAAYVCGRRPFEGRQGTTVNGLYIEGTPFGIVDVANARNSGANIITSYGLGWDECRTLAPLRTEASRPVSREDGNPRSFRNFNIMRTGELIPENKGLSFDQDHPRTLGGQWMTRILGKELVYRRDLYTVRLPPRSEAEASELENEHRLFGQDCVQFKFIGRTTHAAPTGPFEFTVDATEWRLVAPHVLTPQRSVSFETVSTDGFSDSWRFVGPAQFCASYDFANKLIIVTPMAGAERV